MAAYPPSWVAERARVINPWVPGKRSGRRVPPIRSELAHIPEATAAGLASPKNTNNAILSRIGIHESYYVLPLTLVIASDRRPRQIDSTHNS